MNVVFWLISAQVALGAFDNLWHHEITERLPAKRAAATEVALHAGREFIYALIFIALAWYEWHGAWAALVAAAFAVEIVITLCDFVVEDRTRRLPMLERILHTILAINLGLVLAALGPVLLDWWRAPSLVVPVHYGVFSWVFSAFAVGVLAWSIRNALAALRHHRPPEWVRDPIVPGQGTVARHVLISGATGFIGGHLVRRLIARGDSITVYTRDADHALDRFGPHVHIVTNLDAIPQDSRIDAIVNLAGARILGLPWTKGRRRVLIDSRVRTTRALADLCARLDRPPRAFVSASAIGFYGVRGDERLDEQADGRPIFQSQLCQEWEAVANAAHEVGSRVVRLRFGLVLGRDGGALPSLALPVRLGLGAILGSGKHWVSWIHIEDLIRLIELALDKPLQGVMNAVAPNPVTHREMQRTLARTLRRPMWLRAPAILVRMMLGEMSQLLVDGQRVVPRRALAEGFVFRHPHLRQALHHLLVRDAGRGRAELTEMYFNGECPVCSAEMSHYEKLCTGSPLQTLRFIDATRSPLALADCGLSLQHLERRVYLKNSKGSIVSGLPALIEIWSRMPQYRWLARLTSLPLLNALSVGMYDHVIAPGLAAWARLRKVRATV